MEIGFYEASAAMSAQMAWYDLLSQNLASANNPGAKREVASFQQYQFRAGEADPEATRVAYPVLRRSLDTAQGPLKTTGVRTDLALQGPGWLAVGLPDGSTALTRDGELHLDARGTLVTKSGYPVAGAGGPIQLDPARRGDLSVAEDGTVSQGDQPVGQLAILEVNDPASVSHLGGGLYRGANARPAVQTTVKQGALEAGNGVPVSEMVELMLAARHFEANQKVLQGTDERVGKAIVELGAPPQS